MFWEWRIALKKKLPRPPNGVREAKEQALRIDVRQLEAKGKGPAEIAQELGQSEKIIEEVIQRLRTQSIYTNQDLRVENVLASYLQRLQVIDSATWRVVEEAEDVWQQRALLLDLRTSLHKSLKEVMGAIKDLVPPAEPEQPSFFDVDVSKLSDDEKMDAYGRALRRAVDSEKARVEPDDQKEGK